MHIYTILTIICLLPSSLSKSFKISEYYNMVSGLIGNKLFIIQTMFYFKKIKIKISDLSVGEWDSQKQCYKYLIKTFLLVKFV